MGACLTNECMQRIEMLPSAIGNSKWNNCLRELTWFRTYLLALIMLHPTTIPDAWLQLTGRDVNMQGLAGRAGGAQPCSGQEQFLGGAAGSAQLQGPRRMLAQAAASPTASHDGNAPTAAVSQAPKAHLNHGDLAEALISQRQHKRVEDAAAARQAPAPADGLPRASHKGGRGRKQAGWQRSRKGRPSGGVMQLGTTLTSCRRLSLPSSSGRVACR